MAERGAWREFALFAGIVLIVCAAVGLLGLWPTRRLAGDAALPAIPVALGVAAVGSFAGALPVLIARLRADVRPHVVLVSMLVRLFVVVALAALVLLFGTLPMTPFLLWLAVGYLALLAVDTGYAIRLADGL